MPLPPDVTVRYNPEGLGVLSDEAASSPDLEELAFLAESALGLHDVVLTDPDHVFQARLAVALQVNHIVEHGNAARLFRRIERGERTWVYREDEDGAGGLLDPMALRLAEGLIEDEDIVDDTNTAAVIRRLR